MKRKILIGGGVVVALLGSALIAPSFINWNSYKGRILTQLHSATGHDYDIGGPMALSILPFPHVEIGDLTVKAPKDQGGATLLTLDRADVSVELLPLLSGRVDIRSITLEKPVFNIAIGKDGAPSWMTPKLKSRPQQNAPGKANASSAPSSVASKVVLQSVNIHNGAFRFTDARSGASYAAQNINIRIKADTLYGPYAVNGDLDYNGEKIEVDLKTGAIGTGADSVAAQLKATVPSAGGGLQFAGVVGLKAPYQIQGETTLDTKNFAALLKPFVDTPPGGLDGALMSRPVALKGLMTYAGDSFALRNTQLSYAGNELDGDIAVSGIQKPQATVQVTLAADKPVDLDGLMAGIKPALAVPLPQKSDQSANGDAVAHAGSFLPKTLTLPFALGGKASVTFKTATYKGQSFDNAGLSVAFLPKSFVANIQSSLPGKGTLTGSMTLGYAASVKNDSGVILSDPSLLYRLQVKDQAPRTLLGIFLPPDKLKTANGALSAPLALDITGTVTPSSITASAGSLDLAGTSLALSGSYTPQASHGRDAVKLVVSTDRLDVDQWFKPGPEPAPVTSADDTAKAVAALPPAKTDVTAAARSLALPFDLDLGATAKVLHYGGNDYGDASVKATLTGNELKIADAGFDDQSGNVLHVSGIVGDLKTLGDIDISLNGKTPDASLLLKTLKVDAASIPANAGSASAVAEFKGQADKLGFTANVTALRGSLDASGSLSDLLSKPSLGDLTFRLKHPNYEALVRLFDPSFHASVNVEKNLDIFASLQRTGNVYAFKQLKATVGPTSMEGNITADMGGSVPSVTASLQFTSLPLDKLLGAQVTSNDGATTIIRPDSSSRLPGGGGHWSRTPIDTAWMRKWDADIKTSADNVTYGNWKFSNATLDFTLKDGALTMTKLDGGLYGGHIDMTGKMATAAVGGALDTSADIKLKDVSIESFVQSFAGSHLIKAQGTVNLDSTLAAKGKSAAALISALQGKGTMTGKDLDFQGFDLAQLSGVLAQPSSSVGKNFSNILGSATSGGSTHFDTLDGAYTVAAGVISFDKMKMDGKDADVDTVGTINLPLWTVDMTSTILLAEPKANPPPPLKISFKGPLDNPAQAFGKSAMESYFMKQYGSKIQSQLDKLDKSGVLGKTGIGSVISGVLGQQPTPGAGNTGGSKTVQPQPLNPKNQATPATPAQQTQPVKPEDAFKGLLNNMLTKQH